MKKKLMLMLSCILLAGCGSTLTSLSTVGIDNMRFDIPTTYEKQVEQEQYNTKLGPRPVLVFAEKAQNTDDFSKNVIVTKTAFNPQTSTLDAATAIMVDSIQTTFGSYEQEKLRTKRYECGDENKQAYLHSFTVAQGSLENVTRRYISQYYFVESDWLYVISGISHEERDMSDYEDYFKTLKCKQEDGA